MGNVNEKSNVKGLTKREKTVVGISVVILTSGIFSTFFVRAVCNGLLQHPAGACLASNLDPNPEMEFSCPVPGSTNNVIVCQWAEALGVVQARADPVPSISMPEVEPSSNEEQPVKKKRRNLLARLARRNRNPVTTSQA
eukprot:CAMPEP_0116546972 /NCGR_PEP_ID=MMETSP0397-20121206/3523_1 /TAXON_ID=216820 /ORGANISM="Cyclophora tenuis, Strain ECT3854" /LENGTH=138 /DNA_ID=CAMNT_0004071461 /DNA_START=72 /DNA_END=488 /DNA_ORIENTATION=+